MKMARVFPGNLEKNRNRILAGGPIQDYFMARLHYLDNLRWMSILVLFPFHAAFVFCAGWYGYYISSPSSSTAAHCLTVAIEPWIMPLLFCIAGMSARFALQERTPLVYLKERVTKLLVPFLAGLVFICPVVAYYALKFHTGYTGSFAGAFVHFFSTIFTLQDRSGILGDFSVDHLWFIISLFIISVVALGVILLGQRLEGYYLGPKSVSLPALALLAVPLWLLNFVGFNMTGYSLVSYFALFLIGYFLLAMDSVQTLLEQHWGVLLSAWIVLTIGVMWTYGILMGHDEVFWGSSAFFVVTGWTGVLALMGAGRHLADVSTAFTGYMAAASYPVYIIHQAVLVAVAYYAVMLPIPAVLQYLFLVISSILLTFACYEMLRRIPGVRELFGITGPRQKTV
jgi:peptidoglycan/LPS O-acetylase OafA/YrhL